MELKDHIKYLSERRDKELDALVSMIKNNSDRLKIEDRFSSLMREQNNLNLSLGAEKVLNASTYGAYQGNEFKFQ
jgi:hypothetical protein